MSDFHPKKFKWSEMMSILLEQYLVNTEPDLVEKLGILREYANEKYQSAPEIENTFLDYWRSAELGPDELRVILVQMFGEPKK